MSDLFRKEVLQARRAQWLGTVSLAQSLRMWWLVAFAVAAASSIVLFLVFGDYTRRTRVIGQLVPNSGLLTLTAPIAGVVGSVSVQEGDAVVRGSNLALIQVPAASSRTANLTDALGGRITERADAVEHSYAAQSDQLTAREQGLRAQIVAARAESQALHSEQLTRDAQVALGTESLKRVRQLREKQFVTAAQVQQQETQWLEQKAAVQVLQRARATLARQTATLQQELAELPAQREVLASAQRRDRAILTQEGLETEARGDAVVRAPLDGRVTALLGLTGQNVQRGQALLTLLPAASALEAHLLVPSRAIGFIAPGDHVLLRYQAFPYQKFGQGKGQVLRVSRSALSQGETAALAVSAASAEPLYRVVVTLDQQTVRAFGNDEALKPGMLLEADVLGESRKLWEWVLEPLFTVSGRV